MAKYWQQGSSAEALLSQIEDGDEAAMLLAASTVSLAPLCARVHTVRIGLCA